MNAQQQALEIDKKQKQAKYKYSKQIKFILTANADRIVQVLNERGIHYYDAMIAQLGYVDRCNLEQRIEAIINVYKLN